MSSSEIRVLLADDQKLFADCLRYVVESRAPDIRIVAVARNGTEAVELSRTHRPDIILMDVRMPGLDGVMATQIIRAESPDIKILMLSTFQDDNYVRTAMRYGAVGYLLKNIAPEKVIAALRAVNSGIVQISPAIARSLMGGDGGAVPESEEELLLEPLTRREREVLVLISKPCENQEIATLLDVSPQTAKNYVHNLYAKLGVSNRVQLMQLLQRTGVRKKLGLE